ncbi:MAG: HAMP domain-containing protein [Gammaproteobacteria bacterium]|jgi:two-component system, OmpR family, sensor histidine kinase CpxA|nr:HAMP domain-containing protein [Gammaproteobacteria bacterium]MBU2278892.1 HAMP domain-containing protein [Gammaproteobacteria bacterium]
MKFSELNPYRLLAFRIFGWFWLVLLLTLGGAWLLARGWSDDTEIRRLPHGIAEQLEPLLKSLHKADSIEELAARLNRRDRNRWLIVEPELNQILNSEILPRSFDQNWLTELSQLNRPRLLIHRKTILAGPFLVKFKTKKLALYQIRPRPQSPGLDLMSLPNYLLPALLVLVSALASFILALTITKPLRLLKQKNLDFAAGDLSARADAPARRSDEIGELSRGFNLMAAKIGDLLQNQQRLLRDVSHELRSPLTRAQLAIALEQRQGGGAQLPRLQQELERVDQLLGELLTFSRLDAGQYQLQRQDVDLYELIEEVITVNQLEAEQKQLQVTLNGRNPCPLNIEPKLLARAIENILRNAIKYSPDAASIGFQLSQTTTETILAIADQGPGIPADSLEQIFEPFYRVSDSRNSQTGGTGLGLAIAAQVVRQHGGQIVASLPASGGLCITMTLPHRTLAA